MPALAVSQLCGAVHTHVKACPRGRLYVCCYGQCVYASVQSKPGTFALARLRAASNDPPSAAALCWQQHVHCTRPVRSCSTAKCGHAVAQASGLAVSPVCKVSGLAPLCPCSISMLGPASRSYVHVCMCVSPDSSGLLSDVCIIATGWI